MARLIIKQQIQSHLQNYSIIIETYQTRNSYETTTRALVNNYLKEPLIRKYTGTIISALKAQKHQVETAKKLLE